MYCLPFPSPFQSITQSNEGYPNILDANGPEVFFNFTSPTVRLVALWSRAVSRRVALLMSLNMCVCAV